MVDTTTENSTKKRVPDWLNSSLWSSTPDSSPPPEDADDVSGQSQTIKSATTTYNSSLPKESPETPPQMEPPVIVQEVEPAPKLDTRNPLCTSSSGYGNYDSHVEENEVIIASSGIVSDYDATSSKDVMQTPRVAPGSEDISRGAQILQELSRKVVNLVELRRLSSQGLPDGGGIRATVWKLLLAYLPCDHSLWSSELEKKRSQYMSFKEEMLMNPTEITRRLEKSSIEDDIVNSEDDDSLSRSEVTDGEHPLSLGKTSVWNQFFQDTEIMEQIDRDVKRTHPDFNFFSGDSSFARSNQDALRNILIIFAKLNPGIRYVQGMNEILAPIYYVFRSDPDEENSACAEADSFFCFVEILSGFRDNFCQQLDNSVVGIRATISRLSQLLKDHDEELWRHLEITTKVNPQFYAFRWITLLLTQEFNFPDSLFIWDTLLSDPDGPQETLLRICCAMLIIIRKRLLAGDFTANLKLLQNYPPTNISHLLYVANKLRAHLGS